MSETADPPEPGFGESWEHLDLDVAELLYDFGKHAAEGRETNIEHAFEHGTVDAGKLTESARWGWDSLADWVNAIEWFVDEHGGEIEPGEYETVGIGGPQFYSSTVIELLAMHHGYDTHGERRGSSEDGDFDFVVVVEEAGDGE